MKTSKQLSLLMIFSLTLLSFAFGQPPANEATPHSSQEIQRLSRGFDRERLSAILAARKTEAEGQTIDWYETGYGYYGIYSIGTIWYMARYDKEFNYIEILTERDWIEHAIPRELRLSFRKSPFKSRVVAGFWETTDLFSKNYYLELEDRDGNLIGVWADQQGIFSDFPPEMGAGKVDRTPTVATK